MPIDISDCKTVEDLEKVSAELQKQIYFFQNKFGVNNSDLLAIKSHKEAFDRKISVIKLNPKFVFQLKQQLVLLNNTTIKMINERLQVFESKELNEILAKKEAANKKKTQLSLELQTIQHNRTSNKAEQEELRKKQADIKNKEEKQVHDALIDLEKARKRISLIDDQIRTEQRKIAPNLAVQLQKTIMDILKGAIADYTAEVKQYVDCVDKRQLYALAIYSINTNNAKLFDWIVDGIEDYNFQNNENKSLLLLTIGRSYPIFLKLLENGADVKDPQLLFAAISAEKQPEDYCKKILEFQAGINLEIVNHIDDQQTALYLASLNNNITIVKLLCDFGANIELGRNIRTNIQVTPLEIAAEKGHTDVVDFFIHRNANTKKLNLFKAFHALKYIPVVENSYEGFKNATEWFGGGIYNNFLYLLKKIDSKDINQPNSEGHTLLLKIVFKKDIELCEIMLQCKADINAINYGVFRGLNCESTALFLALLHKDGHMSKFLIHHGAEPFCYQHDTSETGYSSLQLAALYKLDSQLHICKEILRSISFEQKAHLKALLIESALALAVKGGHANICKLLISHGANVNVKYSYGGGEPISCFDLALENGHRHVAQLFMAHDEDSKKTFLYQAFVAIEEDEISTLEDLLFKDFNINGKNSRQETLLHCAVKKGCVPICQLLIKHKININLTNKDKKTPLELAIEMRNIELCHELLKHGADPLIFSTLSLLIIAVKNNLDTVVNSIIQALNLKGLPNKIQAINFQYEQKTALFWAAEQGNVKICQYLIEQGANVSIAVVNKSGGKTTPLDIAIENGHSTVAELLIKAQAKPAERSNDQNEEKKVATPRFK